MRIEVTRKEQLQTNNWSGGTTTQLAIYPKDAQYKNHDFIFRISTATIDVEQSTFTSLPNVSRVIMVLSGELTIQHKNQYNKKLNKFDTDTFSGNWKTTSVGKAIDFNVMTQGNVKVVAKGFSLPGKENKEFELDNNLIAVYIHAGEVLIKQPLGETLLAQGDIALIYKEHINEAFTLQGLLTSDVIIVHIGL